MAFGKNKTLRVEFYEAKHGTIVGYDEMRLRDVPEDFEAETWVDIDGDRWKVVGVEPSKPRKALKSGTLVVHVELVKRKEAGQVEETTKSEEAKAAATVEAVKEATVYVSPSRADQLPRMSGKRENLRLLEMATWEWRNIEFTLAANRSTVQEVFGKIKELVSLNSTERDGRTFYTRQYERYDMFAPLRGTKLKLEQIIEDYYPAAMAVDGLTFMGSDQVANSTFVFMVGSGTVFYGQEFDEVVRYLALHRPDQLKVSELREDAEVLAKLMKKKDLILVDWTLRQVVEADENALQDYLLAGFAKDAVAIAKQELTAKSSIVHSDAPVTAPEPPKVEAVPAVIPVVVAETLETQAPETESDAPVMAPEVPVAEKVIESVPVAEQIVEAAAVVEPPKVEVPAVEAPVAPESTPEPPKAEDSHEVLPVESIVEQANVTEQPAPAAPELAEAPVVQEVPVEEKPALDASANEQPIEEHIPAMENAPVVSPTEEQVPVTENAAIAPVHEEAVVNEQIVIASEPVNPEVDTTAVDQPAAESPDTTIAHEPTPIESQVESGSPPGDSSTE